MPTIGGEMTQGHPKGLSVCFGAEMFERLCYYGMRGLLILYLTDALMQGDTKAIGIYGAYTALVYAAPVWGGKLADAVLGFRRAVVFGGIVMAVGEFMILGGTETWLYLGMAAIIVGNGFFKANISTIVGRLYKDGDPLRDSGFTIFYMGINIGALLATVAVAPIGEKFGYHWGFLLAGIGMLAGIAIFLLGQDKLEGAGEPNDPEALAKWGKLVYIVSILAIPALYALITYGGDVTILGKDLLFWILMGLLAYVCFNLLREGFKGGKVARDRIIVLMILMTFNVVFWAFFEQAGSSLTLFALRNVDRNVMGFYEMPASQTQFFNPAFIILFGSLFSVMWIKLSKMGRNPSIPMKFGMGILQLGLGYLALLLGAGFAGQEALVPLIFLGIMYLLHTTGELFLSPIGLSMVTKLAPKHMTGAAMGAWFLSFAFSMYVAAVLAKLTGSVGEEGAAAAVVPPAESLTTYLGLFGNMGYVAVGIGLFLMLLSKPLTRLMHGVE
ncbi:MAG: oligopeptide:H+ symporter [Candidatus Krumholzibacteriota bacterium]